MYSTPKPVLGLVFVFFSIQISRDQEGQFMRRPFRITYVDDVKFVLLKQHTTSYTFAFAKDDTFESETSPHGSKGKR